MGTSRTQRRADQLTQQAQKQQQNGITAKVPLAILPDAIYPLADFMQITGKRRHAMREARKRGLPVMKDGRRVYVRGADYFRYLEKINSSSN